MFSSESIKTLTGGNYECYCLIFRTPKYFEICRFQSGPVAGVKIMYTNNSNPR